MAKERRWSSCGLPTNRRKRDTLRAERARALSAFVTSPFRQPAHAASGHPLASAALKSRTRHARAMRSFETLPDPKRAGRGALNATREHEVDGIAEMADPGVGVFSGARRDPRCVCIAAVRRPRHEGLAANRVGHGTYANAFSPAPGPGHIRFAKACRHAASPGGVFRRSHRENR